MADVKIQDLLSATTVADTDLFIVEDNADTKKITKANLANALGISGLFGLVGLGGVVESGSNANGQYVKFSDGTMICWRCYESPFLITPILDGSTYQAEIISAFAAAFTSSPSVMWSGDIRLSEGYSRQSTINRAFSSGSETTVAAAVIFSPNNYDRVFQLSFVAIGRWK